MDAFTTKYEYGGVIYSVDGSREFHEKLQSAEHFQQNAASTEILGSCRSIGYLATGCTLVALSLHFARGDNTISRIVAETTTIMKDRLKQTYMPIPRTDQWKRIAQRFYSLWNLPNCIGAIDGKHIRIEKFPNAGSSNFNYKSYHSVILMACCDADGLFTLIETGYDGGVFRASAIKHWIKNEGRNIPGPTGLPDDDNGNDFPYYFVGDEAFPLSRYLMRPYPQRTLDNRRIFNYRLSRGRKSLMFV